MTKVRQLSDIQVNAEIEDNNDLTYKEIIRTEMENTPFIIISMEGYHFGSMGDYRITEKYETLQQVREDLAEMTWNRIVQIVALIIEKLK